MRGWIRLEQRLHGRDRPPTTLHLAGYAVIAVRDTDPEAAAGGATVYTAGGSFLVEQTAAEVLERLEAATAVRTSAEDAG